MRGCQGRHKGSLGVQLLLNPRFCCLFDGSQPLRLPRIQAWHGQLNRYLVYATNYQAVALTKAKAHGEPGHCPQYGSIKVGHLRRHDYPRLVNTPIFSYLNSYVNLAGLIIDESLGRGGRRRALFISLASCVWPPG